MVRIFSVPPPIPDNPYQRLLYDAVREAGGILEETEKLGLRRPRPAPPGGGILHVHWLWLRRGFVRRRLRAARLTLLLGRARYRGWRLVWTAHNVRPHDGDALDQRVYASLARQAAGIIAHTQLAADQIRETYAPEARITVIPHGHYRDVYDAPPPPETCRHRLGLDHPGPLLLAFGQVRPYKGFLELAQALAAVERPDLRLVIAGRPEDRGLEQALRACAAQDERIILRLGFVPDEEVPLYFGAADWAALPYRHATTSGTLALACSFGCPVIAPADGPVVEDCEPEALELFQADADLAAAIHRALERDRETAAAAARRQGDALDWAPIGARTLRFFEEILAG